MCGDCYLHELVSTINKYYWLYYAINITCFLEGLEVHV